MANKKTGRGRINKAQAIRDTLAVMGRDSAPKDVIAELATKKITVSAAQVSNVKAELARKAAGGTGKGKGDLTVATLLEAKQLADKLGGVEQARRALDTLARLR